MIDIEPVTPEYAAWTTTAPSAMPVTSPVEETVASEVSDDCHVATLVTSCVVPSDNTAAAASCDVAPTTGADPVTLMDETVLGDDVEFPHAAANPAKAIAVTNARIDRAVTICL